MSAKRFFAGLFSFLSVLLLFASGALAATTYQVQPGDSLYLIGERFGVSPESIQQVNGLSGTDLYPGQQLAIPGPPGSFLYTVRQGDTLYLLGQRFGLPYREIMRANGLTTTSLYSGQVLTIPGGQGSNASRGAGSPSSWLSASDLQLMSQLIYGEARGEPYTGQVAVAAVVLNRVESPLFPDTVREVIFQPGAFTSLYDGQFYLTPDSTARQAARDAANGWDPSGGALYYWNPATATNSWVWTRPITARIGNHVFAA